GSEKMMNGAGPEPPRSSTAAEDRTLPQPSGSAAVSGVSDFLSAPSSATDRDRAPEAQPPPEALTSSERDVNVFSATAPRVEVGSYEFSPPEDLPEPRSTAEVNSQPFWFAKIGEFVQRRVAQAGAAMTPILESGPRRPMLRQVLTPPPRSQRLFTPEAEQTMSQWTRRAPHLYTPEQRTPHQEGSSNGSLTQEQVLAEVQKQVKFEMRVHEEERQLLAQENRQLKARDGQMWVELRRDPREAVMLVAAVAIPADYPNHLMLSADILPYRIRPLMRMNLRMELEGVRLEVNEASEYLAVIHLVYVQGMKEQSLAL
ncbi:TY2B-DR3, partial [Symbiodinium microadriaticum]